MKNAISKDELVSYEDSFRHYGILHGKLMFPLYFCPWCGVKLPPRLHSKIYDVIYEEFGIPYFKLDMDEFIKDHSEFGTDEWWKKRGL